MDDFYQKSAVENLFEIADAIQKGADAILEVKQLKEQVIYWKSEYDNLLNQSLKHNQEMAGAMLKGILDGVITIPDGK